jgi:hypothetical protein
MTAYQTARRASPPVRKSEPPAFVDKTHENPAPAPAPAVDADAIDADGPPTIRLFDNGGELDTRFRDLMVELIIELRHERRDEIAQEVHKLTNMIVRLARQHGSDRREMRHALRAHADERRVRDDEIAALRKRLNLFDTEPHGGADVVELPEGFLRQTTIDKHGNLSVIRRRDVA